MDDIINLGTFDFDLNRLNQNLDTARSRMFELNKQQEANKKQYRDMQKEIDELVKVQGLLENSNAETSEAYRENEARIQALTEAQRANFKVQQDTATQISRVRTEINQTNTQLRAYMTTEGEFISLTEKGNKALQAEINNKNDAIANNKELREIVNQLNPSIQEEADMIKLLNERIDENIQYIRENSSGYDQLKMDIGSYKEQIIAAAQEMNPLNGGLVGFIGRAREAGGVAPLLTSSFAAIRSGLMGATQAGLIFLATPIGAFIAALAASVLLVIGAFKFMTASMNSTEEGSQKLAKVTATIKGIFEGFFKILKPIGEFLGNVFIAYIEKVGEALDAMAEGLASALEFIGADEWAEGIRGAKEEIKASAQAAAELAVAEGKLTKMQRDAVKVQKEYEKQNEILRQQRDDESKSLKEREAANEALGRSLEKQAEAELRIAKQRLLVADLRIKSEGATTDALNERAEAEGIIADIEERITGQRSEQLANLNSLRKEVADAEKQRQDEAKARRQKELDDIVQKKKDEIDLYVAQEAGKKKALQDSLTFEETMTNKRLDLLQKEFNAGKMSKEAYESEKLNITNEYALKQIEIINEYALAEIDLYKQANQSKIANETLLTEAIIAEEERRLNELRRMDLEQLQREKQTNDEIIAAKKLRNEKLTLDEIEYQTQRLAIDQQYNQQIDTNRQSFNAQVKARDLAQQEADNELALLNANNEYERQLLEEQERYDAGLVRLNERLQKEQVTRQQYDELMLAYQKENAEKEKQINDAKEQAIRSQYAATFGNVAKLLGEKTAAGKAASIAEATINTYNGITQVWASPSTLPEPFATVAKAVNTGVVLASGLAAVKKISGVDTKGNRPSYADGVIGLSGSGTGDSDSIVANLSRGESVINAQSTAMFPNLLSAINQAGGGVGIDGASSILSQNELTQRADNSQLSTVVANAVRIGAAEGTALGSQTGITELSNNRKVMADAKF